MVLTPPVSDVPALIDALDRGDMPYVRLAPSYPSVKGLEVSTDDRSAARDMTRYLIGLGHRRIGFVAGHPDHGAAHERLRGYRDALAEGGLQVDDSLVEQGLHSFDSGVHCGDRLLDRADRPSAIFAGNDDMAAGVLYAAHARGIKVPDELSVAGYDDTPLSRQTWPADHPAPADPRHGLRGRGTAGLARTAGAGAHAGLRIVVRDAGAGLSPPARRARRGPRRNASCQGATRSRSCTSSCGS